MDNKLILPENYKKTYDKIAKMIETAKHKVFETANFQTCVHAGMPGTNDYENCSLFPK